MDERRAGFVKGAISEPVYGGHSAGQWLGMLPDPHYRALASTMLRLFGHTAIPSVIRALRDEPDLREEARPYLWALCRPLPDGARNLLIGMLRDPDAGLRREAVWAMEQLEFSPRVDELLDIVRNGNDSAKRDAARLFREAAEGGDLSPDWIADLCGLLNDSCPDVRRLAIETLARLGPAAAAATIELLAVYAVQEDDLWIEAATALSQIGTPAMPDLAAALHHSHAPIRRAALEVLGSLCRPNDPVVEQMIECLHDADAHVRHAAADAMATCGAQLPEACAAA